MDQPINTILHFMEMLSNSGESPRLTIEAILPYLPEERQWQLRTFSQMMQLCRSISEHPENTLALVRPHVPPKTQRIIDLFMKISEINELMNELFQSAL